MVNAAATLLKKEILQPIAENLAFPLFAAVIYADGDSFQNKKLLALSK